jgi:uncharacterized membrane protein YgcG
MSFVRKLDTPLMRLSPYSADNFTLDNACTGIHCFGGIGSGKTSGVGKAIRGAYLRAGMGGFVTAVQPAEVPTWIKDAKEHWRARSIFLFDETQGFNFITYELSRHGMAGIGTVVESIMRILEAAKRASATASQKGGEVFWEDTSRQTIRYTLPPIYSAKGEISIRDIVKFISSAPNSPQEAQNPEWQRRSFMYEVMSRATFAPKIPMEEAAMRDCIAFWSQRFPAIPDKTRGNIIITVTSALDRFMHGRLEKAFCGKTTIVPEMTFHGAIILPVMSTLTWNEDGIIAQQLLKFFWQRAVLGRNSLEEKHRERPVFLYSDEAQETVSSYDEAFVGLCRQSLCCPVFMTQSLPAYYAKIGTDNPQGAASALVGKFKTLVFNSNSCPETNEYAARVLGKVITRRGNYSAGNSRNVNVGMNSGQNNSRGSSHGYSGHSGGQGGYSSGTNTGNNHGSGESWGDSRGRGYSDNVSRGYSESMEYQMEPGDFGRILKTGGRANNFIVTGVWYQNGRIFEASGSNMLIEAFKQ